MRLATANREINSLSSRLPSLFLSFFSSFLPICRSMQRKKSLFLLLSFPTEYGQVVRERETDLSAIKNRRGFVFKLERLTRQSCGHSSPCSRNKREEAGSGRGRGISVSSIFALFEPCPSLFRKRVLHRYISCVETIIKRYILPWHHRSYVNFEIPVDLIRERSDRISIRSR